MAEDLEAVHEPSDLGFGGGGAAGVEVSPEVLERFPLGQDVPADHQDRVGYRYRGSLVAAAGGDSPIAG